MTKRHRAASVNSRRAIEAMTGKPPLTCREIGAVIGLDHRHVRSLLGSIIERGDAFMVPDTFPGRYSLNPDAVYIEPQTTGWEDCPPTRIHRPVGAWEGRVRPTAGVSSVFQLGAPA